MFNSEIIATGSFWPKRRLINQNLEKMVDTSDKWIMERVGIKERPIAWPWETPSVLAANAGLAALKKGNVSAKEIDLIIVATVKGDYHFPACACQVQNNIGAKNAYAYDTNAGCTGFIYALRQADNEIKLGYIKTALVIGVEKLSDLTDYTDRNTCVLFGDGAGAFILRRTTDINRGILATCLYSDGSLWEMLWCTNEKDDQHFLKMEGHKLFKKAVNYMLKAGIEVLEKSGYQPEDLDYVIPHQANYRIIAGVARKIGLEKKVVYNIEKMGNTSSATVPMTIDQMNQEGKIKEGDLILLDAFGAGLTWGAALIRW